jgi:ubiquinone/menaquinone biosynthesis C-methylase UbiE
MSSTSLSNSPLTEDYEAKLAEMRYWEERKADSHSDWGDDKTFLESYRESVNHPHRQLIIDFLKDKEFNSLLEVGCCNGPNLFRIAQEFQIYPSLTNPGILLAGEEVNEQAVKDGNDFCKIAWISKGKLPDINQKDKSFDYVLADACLMYVEDIDKALSEMKRVAKKGIIIFDWETENEEKINYSYTRNWVMRLHKAGFDRSVIRSLTEQEWPNSENWKKYGRFITAQVQ